MISMAFGDFAGGLPRRTPHLFLAVRLAGGRPAPSRRMRFHLYTPAFSPNVLPNPPTQQPTPDRSWWGRGQLPCSRGARSRVRRLHVGVRPDAGNTLQEGQVAGGRPWPRQFSHACSILAKPGYCPPYFCKKKSRNFNKGLQLLYRVLVAVRRYPRCLEARRHGLERFRGLDGYFLAWFPEEGELVVHGDSTKG